jgi:hypothetical protein
MEGQAAGDKPEFKWHKTEEILPMNDKTIKILREREILAEAERERQAQLEAAARKAREDQKKKNKT